MRHLAVVVSSVFVVLLGAASVAEARPPTCTTCPVGEYCDLASTGLCQPCSTCSPGTFEAVACDVNTDTVCSSCPANCTDCTDGSTCNQCDVGYWFFPDPIGGSPACMACTVCQPGEVEVQTCDFGHDRQCAATCPAGTYDNNGVCDACTAANCAQCSAASSCDVCADGYYLDVTNGSCVACTTCTAGQRIDVACGADHDATCVDCTAGTYSDADDSAACTMCAAGTFQSQAGQSSCTPCANGETSGAGQTHCDCAAGSAGTSGMCSSCPAGTFAMSAGSVWCMPCSAGTYSTAGAVSCTACAAGSYSGAGGNGCTPCAAGTYAGSPGSAACTPCGVGYVSAAGATSCMPCAEGQTSSVDFSTCVPAEAVCGNGVREAGEECDLGAGNGSAECTSRCYFSTANGGGCRAAGDTLPPWPVAALPLAFAFFAWRRRRRDD